MSDKDGKIRVAIMDDHQGILDGYLYRLQGQAEIQIIGTIRYGDDLEPLLARQPVDVLLLDMQVPSSLDNPNPFPVLPTIPRLVQLYPDMSILAISMHNQRTLIQATMDAGASKLRRACEWNSNVSFRYAGLGKRVQFCCHR